MTVFVVHADYSAELRELCSDAISIAGVRPGEIGSIDGTQFTAPPEPPRAEFPYLFGCATRAARIATLALYGWEPCRYISLGRSGLRHSSGATGWLWDPFGIRTKYNTSPADWDDVSDEAMADIAKHLRIAP